MKRLKKGESKWQMMAKSSEQERTNLESKQTNVLQSMLIKMNNKRKTQIIVAQELYQKNKLH